MMRNFSLVVMASALMASSASAATGRIRYVTDGDTFRLESGERIRIANIDAPENSRGPGEMPGGNRAGRNRGSACPRAAR